jgi:hypothetical protein
LPAYSGFPPISEPGKAVKRHPEKTEGPGTVHRPFRSEGYREKGLLSLPDRFAFGHKGVYAFFGVFRGAQSGKHFAVAGEFLEKGMSNIW